MNKKIIIIIVCALLLCAGAVGAYFLIDNHQKEARAQHINDVLGNIEYWYESFNSTHDKEPKIIAYEGLLAYYAEFNSSDFEDEEITSRFHVVFSNMEDWFFHYYSNSIEFTAKSGASNDTDIINMHKKANELSAIKTTIQTDGIFKNDLARQNQLFDEIDRLISFLTETIDWLDNIDNINDRFDKANRDERFIIFGEIADMLLEYEKSDFDNIAVFEILELARLNAVSWFSHWYDTRIDLLSTFKKEDNTDDYTHMLELFINALVELNDLTTLFSLERELLFSPSDIDAIYSKLDEAVLSTLSGLKELGIQTINDKDFRGEANEMTLELFDELFEDWKETHKDSEHLNTFDDMLQEAIVFGQAEHDKILEQERRSGSSGSSGGNSSGGSSSGGGGNSGGGGSQTYPMTFICSACEASTTRNLPAGSYRMSHSCDTDYWHNLRNTSGGGSSGGNTPPEPTRTFVQTCVCGVTITLVVPFGQGITETCSCGAVHWATYGYG